MKHAFLDVYSDLRSPLHQLDPRAKLVGFIVLIIICVTTPPDLYAAFAAYLGLEIALVFLSRLPWKHVLKRMLIVLPFILVVAVFIPFFDHGGGSYNLGPLTVSAHGLLVFWNVAAKSTVSVLAVIILSSTTPFPELLKGMEKLKVPHLMTTIMSFMYRYIFVLMDELQRMTAGPRLAGVERQVAVAGQGHRAYDRRALPALLRTGRDGSTPPCWRAATTARRTPYISTTSVRRKSGSWRWRPLSRWRRG